MELKHRGSFVFQSDVLMPHSDTKKCHKMDSTRAVLSQCHESCGWQTLSHISCHCIHFSRKSKWDIKNIFSVRRKKSCSFIFRQKWREHQGASHSDVYLLLLNDAGRSLCLWFFLSLFGSVLWIAVRTLTPVSSLYPPLPVMMKQLWEQGQEPNSPPSWP